jgi:hypothetical protein
MANARGMTILRNCKGWDWLGATPGRTVRPGPVSALDEASSDTLNAGVCYEDSRRIFSFGAGLPG